MDVRLNIWSDLEYDESMKPFVTAAVNHAAKVLKRDMAVVLQDGRRHKGNVGLEAEGVGAMIRLSNKPHPAECYTLSVSASGLELQASDEAGFLYGIYGISRQLLDVQPFWFWNDRLPEKRMEIVVSEDFYYQSKPYSVRLRGWFVNDEVLLDKWHINGDKDKPWEMVFEALLRCGGNMVIPGTDKNSSRHRQLASQMGLTICHHHAEPLGAEMFSRAYPDLNPSYAEHPELFHNLWQEALEEQRDHKVIWNLGFRGQGDCPFWENDPGYETPEARGQLISRLIRMQYKLVKSRYPEADCCTNLYGEVMALYQDGYIDIPEDVIKIWADNGYGKMVSRRQENDNPRVPALPDPQSGGRHGIYYHVSFYDLQAANHITMLTNRQEFIRAELYTALKNGTDDFWLINSSNVKPHVYFLSLIAGLWAGEWSVDAYQYVLQYFSSEEASVGLRLAKCFDRYGECAVAYGEQEDEHAGEQFSNHGTRILATQWLRDMEMPAVEFMWAKPGKTLAEQVTWFLEKGREGVRQYQDFINQCERVKTDLSGPGQVLLEDSLLLHGRIYWHCYRGMTYFGEGFWAHQEGKPELAFYYIGMAVECFQDADEAMRKREHGIWTDFYANECLTDIKQTCWVLEGLMAWIRILDDGPHFYRWQRQYLYSPEDRKVMLILNMENHLTDKEIFSLMKQAFHQREI